MIGVRVAVRVGKAEVDQLSRFVQDAVLREGDEAEHPRLG